MQVGHIARRMRHAQLLRLPQRCLSSIPNEAADKIESEMKLFAEKTLKMDYSQIEQAV